jgi:hypothetical protein
MQHERFCRRRVVATVTAIGAYLDRQQPLVTTRLSASSPYNAHSDVLRRFSSFQL